MKSTQATRALRETKTPTASLIAEAIINLKIPTRRSIAEYSGVTEMTVCRAVSRLCDSYLISERLSSKNRAQALYISEDLRFIIADLTLDVYSAYLLDAKGKIYSQMNYTFNHSVDDVDNLTIFSERARSLFSENTSEICGIGLIFADADELFRFKATDIFTDCFTGARALDLDAPSCLSSLLSSSCDSLFPTDSMYYLCLGNRSFAYYIRDGVIIKSNPRLLIDRNGNMLRDRIYGCITPEIVSDAVFNIVNSASALLDPRLILVESDRFVFGSEINNCIADKLKISFRDGRRLRLSDSLPHYYVKGGLLALQKHIIENALSN